MDWTIPFLTIAAFFAGFIDSMAGGGGLISLPALIAAGVPPHVALGTNKVQSTIGTIFSTTRYVRGGHVHPRVAVVSFAASFVGSFLGSLAVLALPATLLTKLIPILIVIVGVITVMKKNFGDDDRFALATPAILFSVICFTFAIGFYDGFFGPGTGSFLAFGFVMFFHFGFVRATGNAKVANLASNISAFIAFVLHGSVTWLYALPMAAANICGAWLGAGLAIKGGARFIKPVFLCVLGGLLVKIVFF